MLQTPVSYKKSALHAKLKVYVQAIRWSIFCKLYKTLLPYNGLIATVTFKYFTE